MIESYINELFIYYKHLIIFKDILDSREDEYAINQLAISATSVELNVPKDTIAKLLKLD